MTKNAFWRRVILLPLAILWMAFVLALLIAGVVGFLAAGVWLLSSVWTVDETTLFIWLLTGGCVVIIGATVKAAWDITEEWAGGSSD